MTTSWINVFSMLYYWSSEIMKTIETLKSILENSSNIINLPDGISYIKYPISDGVMFPKLYNAIVDLISDMIKPALTSNTLLIGEEDLWWHLIPLIAYKLQLPYALMRWATHWLKGDINIPFKNLYTEWVLNINELKLWDKVIIIEDIIDTGGTMSAMINVLKTHGIVIQDVIAVCDRPEKKWREKIYKDTGIMPKVLVSFITEWNILKCMVSKKPTITAG